MRELAHSWQRPGGVRPPPTRLALPSKVLPEYVKVMVEGDIGQEILELQRDCMANQCSTTVISQKTLASFLYLLLVQPHPECVGLQTTL